MLIFAKLLKQLISMIGRYYPWFRVTDGYCAG
jgi:hypothetical protein